LERVNNVKKNFAALIDFMKECGYRYGWLVSEEEEPEEDDMEPESLGFPSLT